MGEQWHMEILLFILSPPHRSAVPEFLPYKNPYDISMRERTPEQMF